MGSRPSRKLRIGLTGGIASGKSAASAHFARLGAAVIDTDQLSRELVEPGQPALAEIVSAFGPAILQADGRLDRAGLRDLVFADQGHRRRLEAILHPRIRSGMLARAERTAAPYVIFVVPLLAETGQHELVDRVLVVDLPRELQRARLQQRDRLDPTRVEQMLAAQADRGARNDLADDIIDNSGDLASLHAQVEKMHDKYLELSARF